MAIIRVMDELLGHCVRAGCGVTSFVEGGVDLLVHLGRETRESPVDRAPEPTKIFHFFVGR